ncbi:unnamed protein product, partial [Adineta steineri]
PLVLLKVAPDLNENDIKSISSVIRQPNTQIDGLIVSNTTIARMDTLKNEHRNETGGLSGRPLKEKALETLRLFRYYTQGQIPLIGVGGIETAQDIIERMKAGASLVQIYTSLAYSGPPLVNKLNRQLATIMRDDFKEVWQKTATDIKIRTYATEEDLGKIFELPLTIQQQILSLSNNINFNYETIHVNGILYNSTYVVLFHQGEQNLIGIHKYYYLKTTRKLVGVTIGAGALIGAICYYFGSIGERTSSLTEYIQENYNAIIDQTFTRCAGMFFTTANFYDLKRWFMNEYTKKRPVL